MDGLNKIGWGNYKGEGDFIELNVKDFNWLLGCRFHLKKKASRKLLKIFSALGLAQYSHRRVYLDSRLYFLLVEGDKDGRKED